MLHGDALRFALRKFKRVPRDYAGAGPRELDNRRSVPSPAISGDATEEPVRSASLRFVVTTRGSQSGETKNICVGGNIASLT
jgi:hypothetical protein